MIILASLYLFFGSLIEELFPPIPLVFILAYGGSTATDIPLGLLLVLWYSVISSAGKLIGSWVLYALGDKGEDVVLRKYGKYLGISHKDVEAIGKRFEKRKRNGLTLFFLRVIPLIPSSPVSLFCGIVRIPLRMYLLISFIAGVIRNGIFVVLGYIGLDLFQELGYNFTFDLTSLFLSIVFTVLSFGLLYLYIRFYPEIKKKLPKIIRRR